MTISQHILVRFPPCCRDILESLRLTVALSAVLVVLYGCTERMVYEGARQNQRNECMKMPETERERCLEETSKEYDEYQREREAATGEGSP